MKPTYIRRRRSSSTDGISFKKDNKQEQPFFGETTQEPFFKPGTASVQAATVQRKCADCEGEEKVQRVPENKEEEKIQRSSDKKEEEKIQKKDASSATSNTLTTATTYISSINGKGQPLSPDVQSFYESRIGADFSNVKIHTGKEAEESAKDIHAQAFTYQNHIVFNEGKFQPESSDGKHLLAHELAHVVQQDKNNSADSIKRKTSFNGSSVSDLNMASKFTEAVKSGTNASYVGMTVPYLNGHDLTKTTKSNNPLKLPALKDIQAVQNNGKWESSVRNIPTNSITYLVHLPALPSGNVWSDFVDSADISKITRCKGQINVYIKGKPSITDVIASVDTHEQVHVKDLEHIHDGTLTAFDKYLTNAKATGTTEKESKEKLLSVIEKAASSISTAIGSQFNTAADNFHGTTAGAKAKFSITAKDSSCMWIKANVTV